MKNKHKFFLKLAIILVILTIVFLTIILYGYDKVKGYFAFSDSVAVYLSKISSIGYDNKLDCGYRIITYPALSSDGSKIAFCAEDITNNKSIYYLVILEKKDEYFRKYKTIIKLEMDTEIGQVSWSPDNKKIAFLSGVNVHDYSSICKRKLNILNIENKNITNILDNFNFQVAPISWSFDNKLLVFSTPEGEIISYDVDFGKAYRITNGFYPQFSPVKNDIIFSDQNHIYLLNLDTGLQKCIIRNYGGVYLFTDIIWSPDGKGFLYTKRSSSILANLTGPSVDLVLCSVKHPYLKKRLFTIGRGFKGISWSR